MGILTRIKNYFHTCNFPKVPDIEGLHYKCPECETRWVTKLDLDVYETSMVGLPVYGFVWRKWKRNGN